MKKRYLVSQDYGQGGLWTYLYAESPEEIAAKYRDLEVIVAPPAWLTSELQAKLKKYDVDCPCDWVARFVKK